MQSLASSAPVRSSLHAREPWLYSILVPFPVVCFFGAFVLDIVYWRSMSFEWETFSVWLLAAGLVLAGLAALVALVDLVVHRRLRIGVVQLLSGAMVFVLSLINAFVHSRDGYTAVVPTGITLSGIVVLIIVVAALLGRSRLYRNSGAID